MVMLMDCNSSLWLGQLHPTKELWLHADPLRGEHILNDLTSTMFSEAYESKPSDNRESNEVQTPSMWSTWLWPALQQQIEGRALRIQTALSHGLRMRQ